MSDGNWDTYATFNQRDRETWTSIARQLGRDVSAAPAHLSRTLYIPHHDDKVPHLAIYDISERYKAAVGDHPVGSSQFVVGLGVMQKPKDDGVGGIPVLCDVEFDRSEQPGETFVASVRNRGLLTSSFRDQGSAEVEVAISKENNQAGTLTMKGPNTTEYMSISIPTTTKLPISISYPIPPSRIRVGTFQHPYFRFQVPANDTEQPGSKITLEWQIHPTEHGRMRYTLIRIPSHEKPGHGHGADIRAIYHHVGGGASLSLPYSEGVLLVPAHVDSRQDAVVVGSALVMLWRLRGLVGTDMAKDVPVAFTEWSARKLLGSVKGLLGKRG